MKESYEQKKSVVLLSLSLSPSLSLFLPFKSISLNDGARCVMARTCWICGSCVVLCVATAAAAVTASLPVFTPTLLVNADTSFIAFLLRTSAGISPSPTFTCISPFGEECEKYGGLDDVGMLSLTPRSTHFGGSGGGGGSNPSDELNWFIACPGSPSR